MKTKTIAAAALLCLLLAPAAQAKNDPLASGTTKLTLDGRFVSFLKKDGLELTAKSGAEQKGNSYVLAITGGSLDPTTGKGEIDQEGTITFEGAKGKVPLRGIAVKTKRTPLVAKVGGSQLKVARAKRISSKRAGFGSTFQAKHLTFTAKVATRLNKKLRPTFPFTEGQPFGQLLSKPLPKLVTITEQNRATLVFDSAFVAKLDDRFVSLNPIFPAEHVGSTFSFPIAAGGSLAPDGSEGTLRSAGSVELLQLGGGQVFWKELWLDLGARSDTAEVDLEPTPAFPGKIGRAGVLDLGATGIASDPKARTISVSDTSLILNAQSAAQLNQAFGEGKAAFAAGEAVGTVSFAAMGQ